MALTKGLRELIIFMIFFHFEMPFRDKRKYSLNVWHQNPDHFLKFNLELKFKTKINFYQKSTEKSTEFIGTVIYFTPLFSL